MRRTLLVIAAMALILTGALPAPARPPDNPWLQARVLNIAHQGGENEAPSGTLYAFKRATALGADMIELDVHATADDHLVVIHDATVERTTEGNGRVRDLTLAQVQALDAGYGFGAPAYPWRSVRTGEQPPPTGFTPADFAIPSLAEVLAAFPDTPINIEIKGTSDDDLESYLHHARLLAAQLTATGRTDIIVVSFQQRAIAEFHRLAPQIPVAPGTTGMFGFWLLNLSPGGGVTALQIPVEYQGITIATPEFIGRAHRRGFAVHVWMSGQPENEEIYQRLIDACADGIMAAHPATLERVLRERGIARPGRPGVDPCG